MIVIVVCIGTKLADLGKHQSSLVNGDLHVIFLLIVAALALDMVEDQLLFLYLIGFGVRVPIDVVSHSSYLISKVRNLLPFWR